SFGFDSILEDYTCDDFDPMLQSNEGEILQDSPTLLPCQVMSDDSGNPVMHYFVDPFVELSRELSKHVPFIHFYASKTLVLHFSVIELDLLKSADFQGLLNAPSAVYHSESEATRDWMTA